jgi:hypothetical protein
MPRFSPAGAALLDDLLDVVDNEIQRTTRTAIRQHVDAFHREHAPPATPLFSRRMIPEALALVIAERLDAEPDTSLGALAEEYGFPPALVEYAVACLRGQHARACRRAAFG